MNNKIIVAIVAIVIIIAAVVLFNTRSSKTNETQTLDTGLATTPTPSGKLAGAPAVDIARCSKQPNDAYLCPADALSDFGPVTIADTASGNTCELSYKNTTSFAFKGKTKTGAITAGPMAVALYPSGNIATVARSAAQTVSFHAREDGALDHTLLVDSNYSSEQCLSIL